MTWELGPRTKHYQSFIFRDRQNALREKKEFRLQ